MSFIDKLRLRLQPAKQRLRSPNATNAIWNSLDLLVPPALLLISAPFLISDLGRSQFGFWMLLNSFVGLIGALNLGLGDATIKFAAQYGADADASRRIEFARESLTAFAILALSIGCIVLFSSPFLMRDVFSVAEDFVSDAITLMKIGSGWLGLKLFESGCVALVKGNQRFDLAARITLTQNIVVVLAALAMAESGYGLKEILVFSAAAASISIGFLLRTICRMYLLPNLQPVRQFRELPKILSTSFWLWLQGVAGAVFNQADKIVVSAAIGVATLSVYVICLQIGQLIHALFAAAAAFLFPFTSNLIAAQGVYRLAAVFNDAMKFMVPIISAMTVFLYLAAEAILTIAYGDDFAKTGAALLQLNAIAFGGLALSVVPYYLMNGAGLARINVMFSATSAVIMVGVLPYLLEHFGLVGGGVARVANLVVIIPYIVVVKRYLLQSLSWLQLVMTVGAFVLPAIAATVAWQSGIVALSNDWLMIAAAAGCAVFAATASFTIMLASTRPSNS